MIWICIFYKNLNAETIKMQIEFTVWIPNLLCSGFLQKLWVWEWSYAIIYINICIQIYIYLYTYTILYVILLYTGVSYWVELVQQDNLTIKHMNEQQETSTSP